MSVAVKLLHIGYTKMLVLSRLISLFAAFILVLSASSTLANKAEQKREKVQRMVESTMAKLYQEYPIAQQQVEQAAGYGVFSNAHVSVIIASFGGGNGVVINNQSNQKTYMKMGEVGVGLGAGVKDYRFVMIFDNDESLQHFIDKGWVFGGRADAAAQKSELGSSLATEVAAHGIKLYQFTQSGLVLQATVKGTKFWKDKDLN